MLTHGERRATPAKEACAPVQTMGDMPEMGVHTAIQQALKKHPAKTRVLAISKVIDCRVGVVATGHGRFVRQVIGARRATLHGENLAHDSPPPRTGESDMSLREIHCKHSST